MKNTKTIYLWILLLLVVGIIGCSSSGGSSSGGSTTPTTPTTPISPLVGTWKANDAEIADLTFNSDGSGSMSDGHSITNWALSSSNVLTMNINNHPETFQLSWLNTEQKVMSLENIGPVCKGTFGYTKA